MRVRIVDDLLGVISQVLPKEGHADDPEFLALRDRIQGQEVDLRFIGADAFEVIDNNYWLPRECWEPIREPASATAKPVAEAR